MTRAGPAQELQGPRPTLPEPAAPRASLHDAPLDDHTHLVRVSGGSPLAGRGIRSRIAGAVAAGRNTTIVDLSAATDVNGPLAWELSRAHERLLWRGGQVLVVSDPALMEPLFDTFGLHRSPDVVPTLADAKSAANVDRAVARPPRFARRTHEELPATWSFSLQGGPRAPGLARAAVGRLLRGRLEADATAAALLLVNEAVANSVIHGGAGHDDTVELTIVVSATGIRVDVADPVGGFEPPPYPTDPLRTSGRGLPLIHSLAQTWGVDGPPNGRVWFERAHTTA